MVKSVLNIVTGVQIGKFSIILVDSSELLNKIFENVTYYTVGYFKDGYVFCYYHLIIIVKMNIIAANKTMKYFLPYTKILPIFIDFI